MLGELNHQEMQELLSHEVVGRIGCYADGRQYLVPITFVYKEGSVFGHSHEGLKIEMMRKNPKVCFEVDTMNGLNNWKSVVAWGQYEEVNDEGEKRAVFNLLANTLSTFDIISNTQRPTYRLPNPHPHNAGIKAIAFKINIQEMTGRYESMY